MKWYLKALRHYADFSGRARPKEYWMFVLFNFIFIVAFSLIDVAIKELMNGRILVFICRAMYLMAVFLPALAVTVRRLHDTGRSGWWTMLVLTPVLFGQTLAIAEVKDIADWLKGIIGFVFIAGGVWLFVLTLLKGWQGDNRYGSDPKIIQPPYSEHARLRSAAITLIVAAAVDVLYWILFFIRRGIFDLSNNSAVYIFLNLLLLVISVMLLPRMSDGSMPVDRVRRRIMFPVLAYAAITLFLICWELTGRLNGDTVSRMAWGLYYLVILFFALSLPSSGGKWRRAACTTLAVASCFMIAFRIYGSYSSIYEIINNNYYDRVKTLDILSYFLTFFPVACILLSSVFSGYRKTSPSPASPASPASPGSPVSPASPVSPNSPPPDTASSPSGSYYGLSLTSDNQLRYFGASERIELEGDDMPDFIESLMNEVPDIHCLAVPQKGLLIIPGNADSFMAMIFKSPMSRDKAVDYFKSLMAEGKQVKMIEQYAAFEISAALPQTSLDEASPESSDAPSGEPDEVPPAAELSAREHTPQTTVAVPQTPLDEAPPESSSPESSSESHDAPSGKPDEVPPAELPAREPGTQTAVALHQAPANSKFKIQNSKFLKFSGRARRKEFWMFMLFNLIFAAAAAGLTFTGGIIYGLLYLLIMLIPSLAVLTRRLHDAGHSGWWVFLNFVPLIGSVWVLILVLQEGQRGDNRYGRDPKKPSPDALNGKPAGSPAGQEPSPLQNQDSVPENKQHYVLVCKKCGERFHIPQNTALPSGRYVFVPEMCLMFCEYGDTFTVGLETSGFFDVETVPSSGQILKASITDTINMIHPHLIKHYSPLYLEIKQFPKATEHRYALEVPDVKHGGYVKYSDGGMDVVGDIDVSKAEIPPVPRNDSPDLPDSQQKSYPLYTGSGVCDVCNRSLGSVKAYIVPNRVFYASPSWRAYFKRVSFGATDADIKRMETNDRSPGSAVCENCIHMF
jgi:uncharacterized membrane protein YhaH (DUF805 family)